VQRSFVYVVKDEHDKFTPEDIQRIAQLARINVSADEIDRLRHDLDSILEYVRILGSGDVNATGTDPGRTAPLELRPDVVSDSLGVEDVLSNVPVTDNGMFCVPKVKDN